MLDPFHKLPSKDWFDDRKSLPNNLMSSEYGSHYCSEFPRRISGTIRKQPLPSKPRHESRPFHRLETLENFVFEDEPLVEVPKWDHITTSWQESKPKYEVGKSPCDAPTMYLYAQAPLGRGDKQSRKWQETLMILWLMNGQSFERTDSFFGSVNDYWKVYDPIPPKARSEPERTPPENRKKMIRVMIEDEEHQAFPDYGSKDNIMSLDFANKLRLKIRSRPQDIRQFQLGNGKIVQSIGRARAGVDLIGSPLGQRRRWFSVFATCPVPLIFGKRFLIKTEIYAKNAHLLEDCPAEQDDMPSLLWIGGHRRQMICSLDGHDLAAVADTGSDLNFISSKCAKRLRKASLTIDRRREARKRIRFGDCSESETTGQLYVENLGLDRRNEGSTVSDIGFSDDGMSAPKTSQESTYASTSLGQIFHVLPSLPCDLILGRQLLEQTDAFNLCPTLSNLSYTSSPSTGDSHAPLEERFEPNSFYIFVSVGPVAASLLRGRRKCGTTNDKPATEEELAAKKELADEEKHYKAWHAELSRQSKRMAEIGNQASARDEEEKMVREWEVKHRGCSWCHRV